jgi:hypothetical protein
MMCWVLVHGTATAWVHGQLAIQFPDRGLDDIGRTVVDGP